MHKAISFTAPLDQSLKEFKRSTTSYRNKETQMVYLKIWFSCWLSVFFQRQRQRENIKLLKRNVSYKLNPDISPLLSALCPVLFDFCSEVRPTPPPPTLPPSTAHRSFEETWKPAPEDTASYSERNKSYSMWLCARSGVSQVYTFWRDAFVCIFCARTNEELYLLRPPSSL
jgi:hypothetical protein